MKTTFIYLLLLISTLLLSSCDAPIETSSFPTSKEKVIASKELPAFNRELIINIDGDTIAGYAFIAKGSARKETILLVAGYPGNDNNFDIAQEIRRNGKNVIHFNHRGAWGSQGEYSYSSCLEDVAKLIEYFSQDKVAQELRIQADEFVLLGRSYGGGIALIQGSQLNSVKKVIAISSVNYGKIMEKYDQLEELSSFKKYMKKQIMINTNIDDFLQEMLDKKREFNILTYKNQLAKKKVLIIEDSEKNQDWIKELTSVESIIMESDHNFIDKRIELTNLIIQWINK